LFNTYLMGVVVVLQFIFAISVWFKFSCLKSEYRSIRALDLNRENIYER
jgi:hypothetical protein